MRPRAAQVMSSARGGGGGAIVNVSSAAATLGSPHEYVHYAAAKAGVEAMSIGLAKELADQGVRVNAVAPGVVRTGIHRQKATPTASNASWPGYRWDGWPSPTMWCQPSRGCWDRRPAT